jgi:3-carboxy-cis,cis-muconate cycloisomerase
MTVNPADSELYGGLYGTAEMRTLFGERQFVQAMLYVEAALARAEARLGIIPQEAATAITAAARVDNLDLAELGRATRTVGYPVVALVKGLGRAAGPAAAGWVHWGATTQDIMDTAQMLQVRGGLALIEEDLRRLVRALAARARRHRDDVMAGRTHLQHALPITFGYKCAVWLAPFLDHLERLAALRRRIETVEFAGAVGTLASLGDKGRAVVEALAAELGLAVPDAPWHATRERFAEAASFLALVAGSLGKIATDVILLGQSEVSEVAEPHEAGRGGSSTMPQKRNPIASEYILAAMRTVHALVPVMFGALPGDHERSTGPWQSELLALPQIFTLTAGALAQGCVIAEGMTVDTQRMRQNLDATQGLILAEAVMMALAPRMGRDVAHDVLQEASSRALAERRHLADVLADEPRVTAHLDRAAIERILAPENYLGDAHGVVDRVVARAERALGT